MGGVPTSLHVRLGRKTSEERTPHLGALDYFGLLNRVQALGVERARDLLVTDRSQLGVWKESQSRPRRSAPTRGLVATQSLQMAPVDTLGHLETVLLLPRECGNGPSRYHRAPLGISARGIRGLEWQRMRTNLVGLGGSIALVRSRMAESLLTPEDLES